MLRTKKLNNPRWDTFDPSALSAQTAKALAKMEDQEEGGGRAKQYHLQSNDALRGALDSMNSAGSGVVGIVGEIGWIKDEKLDACVGRSLSRYMQTIILNTTKDVAEWKARLRETRHQAPLLSLDNFNQTPLDDEGKIRMLSVPTPVPEGWVGYAANLVELEDKHLSLRPVFFNLLGNKAVFDTIGNARKWRKQLLARNGKVPPLLALDGEKMEANGIEWAGKEAADSGYRFGRMPQIRTEKYRSIQRLHQLFQQYQELLDEKRHDESCREPVDPKNEEPLLRSRYADAQATLKQLTVLLDKPVDTLSIEAIDKALQDSIPAHSQLGETQPSQKRKATKERAEASGGESDAEKDSCQGSVPSAGKKRKRGHH